MSWRWSVVLTRWWGYMKNESEQRRYQIAITNVDEVELDDWIVDIDGGSECVDVDVVNTTDEEVLDVTANEEVVVCGEGGAVGVRVVGVRVVEVGVEVEMEVEVDVDDLTEVDVGALVDGVVMVELLIIAGEE